MSDFEEVVIAPKTEGKGKAFRAMKVSAVMANALWEMGVGDKHDRPVCATFVSSEGEIRPFVANLLTGRPAVSLSDTNSYRRRGVASGYEFMRSAGYKAIFQKHEEGVAATLYLPHLLALDPGMVDPKGVKFVMVASKDYLAAEAKKMDVKAIVDYARCLPVVQGVNGFRRTTEGMLSQIGKSLCRVMCSARWCRPRTCSRCTYPIARARRFPRTESSTCRCFWDA